DLISQHLQVEEELISVFRSAVRSAAFIGGPMVEQFETEFARFCDARHCVGVGSGTDAVRFALAAAGVGVGDVVITVPFTFIATAEAITQVGALPQFVDIDERTYNMDVAKLEQFLLTQCSPNQKNGGLLHQHTQRPVKAVVPVHLYGQMADMDAICELGERYGLTVIEDACQAHGAEYFSKKHNRWQRAGSIGRAAAFSFYPGKNLGACGEGGAVTTNHHELAEKVRMLRDHGQVKKYYHDLEGYNGRLDAIQAGILHAKMRHLPEWTLQRREVAARYNELFANANTGVILPHQPSWARGVYHLYVVRSDHREGLIAHLNAAGIGTGIHYPIPLHLQKAYQYLAYSRGNFPVSEEIAAQVLSLPMYPGLSAEQQQRVVDAIQQFAEQSDERVLAAGPQAS
ncbi:MAG TPA: DegT/DnrJ/EryC1/StrS family aminotransferase, partial [Terriglobales bacterium]